MSVGLIFLGFVVEKNTLMLTIGHPSINRRQPLQHLFEDLNVFGIQGRRGVFKGSVLSNNSVSYVFFEGI